MIIMGIDASTTATGYSIFKDGKLIAYGCIKPKGTDWRERVKSESDTLRQIIDKFHPQKIYMEDVPLMENAKVSKFKKKSPSTTMKLGAVQGCVLAIASLYQIEIEFLLPANWRSPLNLFDGTREGTHRDVLKEKATQMANDEFGLSLVWAGAKSKKSEDDVAEAILIAYSQIKRRKFEKKT